MTVVGYEEFWGAECETTELIWNGFDEWVVSRFVGDKKCHLCYVSFLFKMWVGAKGIDL